MLSHPFLHPPDLIQETQSFLLIIVKRAPHHLHLSVHCSFFPDVTDRIHSFFEP